MKSVLMAIVMIASLVGCSSAPKQIDTPSAKVAKATKSIATANVQETGGVVNLVFDEDGNWVAIATTGVAEVLEDTAAGQENAAMVASMRAKRNIAEFLENSVKSTKTVEAVSKAYSKTLAKNEKVGEADNDEDGNTKTKVGDSNDKAHRFARTVNEKITDSASQIIRGVRVTSQHIEGDRAIVMLEVSKLSIATAKDIRRQISGMMQ